MARTKLEPGKNDLLTCCPKVAGEWDWEKNGKLSPSDVTAKSGKKIWWKCGKGHSWQATISNRVSLGNGCPYCAGRLPIKGETDLAALHPGLCKEWDWEKNGKLSPSDVTAKSGKKIWWKCGKGHSWQATISNRVSLGNGCPYCAGRLPIKGENDLETLRKDICLEWDYDRNIGLHPSDFTVYSNVKVWWVDAKGNHWRTEISDRAYGSDSPYSLGRHQSRTRLI